MGLDIVEFVMAVEDAFDVTIPDRVAERITTPRRLIDCLHQQLPQGNAPRCPTQRAFHVIRRVMVEQHQAPRSAVSPRTTPETALPSRNPRSVWARVGESLGYGRWARLPASWSWFSGSAPRTFGDGARELATHALHLVKPPGEGWSWHEVRWVVCQLMREHFAIDNFRLDDRFVEDLGLG